MNLSTTEVSPHWHLFTPLNSISLPNAYHAKSVCLPWMFFFFATYCRLCALMLLWCSHPCPRVFQCVIKLSRFTVLYPQPQCTAWTNSAPRTDTRTLSFLLSTSQCSRPAAILCHFARPCLKAEAFWKLSCTDRAQHSAPLSGPLSRAQRLTQPHLFPRHTALCFCSLWLALSVFVSLCLTCSLFIFFVSLSYFVLFWSLLLLLFLSLPVIPYLSELFC